MSGKVDPDPLDAQDGDRHGLLAAVFDDDGQIEPGAEAVFLDAEQITAEAIIPGDRVPADSPSASLRREVSLWRSEKMQEVWRIIEQAANIDVTVLISGETGTGKDLVARAIHYLSSRQHAPYVAVNCAAVPKELLESELFGHERGAFTGAHQLKIGKFESANHGTIFLDEIGDLHPGLQAKLLHVLQDGTFSRVGGKSAMKADLRVIAATNRDLAHAVATSRFRDDLYYRLNVIDIVVPPLRERLEEIPLLAAYFMERYSKLYRRKTIRLRPDVMERLKQYRYPGNVRELENIIKRLIILGTVSLGRPMPASPPTPVPANKPQHPVVPAAISLKEVARKAARQAEADEILKMLERVRWNRVIAARLLNISYRSLLYKMKDAGLDRGHSIAGLGT